MLIMIKFCRLKNVNERIRTYSIVYNDEQPWLYYLVKDLDDGVTLSGNTYTYDPDLLPVTPLKVEYRANNNGVITKFDR